jgi:hypothetical protein
VKKGESEQIDTLEIEQVQTAARPDGRKALILYLKGGRAIALEMTPERIRLLMAKLSALLAVPNEPSGHG